MIILRISCMVRPRVGVGLRRGLAKTMAIYQSLFFKEGLIGYWENLESDSDFTLQDLLIGRLTDGGWSAAEAWRDDALVCRVVKPD